MKIKTLSSREIYKNKWMTLREDEIERPSGSKGIYSVVDKPDFAIIVPIEGEYIHLVEQYRYPVEGRYWELPQGTWDDVDDVDPRELAHGELREETGLVAKSLEYVGHLLLAPGLSSQGYHIFLATDMIREESMLDKEEEDLITKKFTIEEFEEMIKNGVIKDASTICAFSFVKLKGLL